MIFPAPQLPTAVRAILLLPAGMRAFDEDFTVTYPPPAMIEMHGEQAGCYELMSRHYGGAADLRACYVLGGVYRPQGCGAPRPLPDEAHDQ